MVTRRLCLIVSIGLLAAAGFAQEQVTPSSVRSASAFHNPKAVAGRYIVTFAPGTSRSARASAALMSGAAVRFNYEGVAASAVAVPNSQALEALRRNGAVLRVVPDFVLSAAIKNSNSKGGGHGGGGSGTPTPLDLNSRQMVSYEVQRVGMPVTGSDGAGIGVAVLDSGIDFNHPDLAPSGQAFNAVSPGASCQDDAGHGTHVAGLIAALNNETGIIGVAPAATLYCVKVLDSNLTGSDSGLMAGLDWVLQHHSLVNPPIRVVNLSLGRPLDAGETIETSVLRPQIQALRNAGVVVVASAGNDPAVEIDSVVPAGFPEVMAVASTVATTGIRTCFLFGDPSLGYVPADTASGFTTDGPGVAVSAPGEERSDIVNLGSSGCVGLQYGILSTTLGTGGVTRKLPNGAEARGTSFSAALVSGIVARVIQKQLVPASGDAVEIDGIRTWIQQNASRVGEAPLDHPWANVIFPYTFDGVREGVAQAPK